MSQNPQSLVKVDGQALADAVNKLLKTNHARQYIASVKANPDLGHPALRQIILQEEARILREALEATSGGAA